MSVHWEVYLYQGPLEGDCKVGVDFVYFLVVTLIVSVFLSACSLVASFKIFCCDHMEV